MKTFTRTLATFALATLFASGCVNEDPAYKNEPGSTPPEEGTGYLALGGMSVRVIYDAQTEVRPDDTAGETTGAATRTEAATDDFIVGIYDAAGAEVLKESYGALKTRFDQAENNRLELPVGNYTMNIRSEEESASPAVAWERPVYGTSYDFSILRQTPTTIGEVVCKLINIKVTLTCSADLAAKLTDDTESTVSLGAASVVFGKGETRAAFFMPQPGPNTLDFRLAGKFADTLEPVEFSKSISDVKAGQWRKITLVISHAEQGDIKLDIDVENFVQDEEIVVNGTEGSWEPGLEEPGDSTAPTIVWKGYDIDKQHVVTPEMVIDVDVTAPAGIRSFVVSIDSETLTPLLPTIGLTPQFDLCDIKDPAMAELLGTPIADGGLGFPINDQVKNKTHVPFSITYFVQMLVAIEGEHNFKLEITDNQGQTAAKTVRLISQPQ